MFKSRKLSCVRFDFLTVSRLLVQQMNRIVERRKVARFVKINLFLLRKRIQSVLIDIYDRIDYAPPAQNFKIKFRKNQMFYINEL